MVSSVSSRRFEIRIFDFSNHDRADDWRVSKNFLLHSWNMYIHRLWWFSFRQFVKLITKCYWYYQYIANSINFLHFSKIVHWKHLICKNVSINLKWERKKSLAKEVRHYWFVQLTLVDLINEHHPFISSFILSHSDLEIKSNSEFPFRKF